jgi:hypothetical protein
MSSSEGVSKYILISNLSHPWFGPEHHNKTTEHCAETHASMSLLWPSTSTKLKHYFKPPFQTKQPGLHDTWELILGVREESIQYGW